MYKIAVMGDRESICGFSGLGIKPFAVTEAAEAEGILKSLCEQDYCIVYITERLCEDIWSVIERYRKRPLPAIIPIPGVKGNTGRGMSEIHKAVEKAVGSDILSK